MSAIEQITAARRLPAIQAFELPATPPDSALDEGYCNNFAALILEDGSVGMTYTALDGALSGLRSKVRQLDLQGRSPLGLIALYTSATGWERALGMSAINAISQHHLRASQSPMPMPATLPELDLQAGDRLGMVGYFGRLVEPVRALGVPLTVVELDARLVHSGPGIEVTLDTSKLRTCTQVIITGTSLLNHTLDTVLDCCEQARRIVVLGPSASCLPEPLFARGVTTVGGFQVTDVERFLAAWRSGGRWRDAGLRYALTRTAPSAALNQSGESS